MIKIEKLIASFQAIVNRAFISVGAKAFGLLRVAADVVNGETVTIGGRVFEVDIINTDSTKNTAGGEWNNTANPITVTMTAHGRAAGDLLRVESEIFKIISAINANTLKLARARSGTAAAAHADAVDIFQSDAAPAANIPVGLVVTLTPAVFTDALVAEINNAAPQGLEENRPVAKASDLWSRIVASGPSDNEVLIVGKGVGAVTLATTETLGGVNNVWSAATMLGGSAPPTAQKKRVTLSRVPTATEVALGKMYFDFDFLPTKAEVLVQVTSTGVETLWNGGRVISTPAAPGGGGRVTLDNVGTVDWAATDTVYVSAEN